MDLNKNFIKNKIQIKRNKPVFSFERDVSKSIRHDYYINVFLTKTCEIFEYVDVKKDEKIFKINRQKINPFYIDFDFFDSIKRIKINTKHDLTPTMKNYLMTGMTSTSINYEESIKNYQNDIDTWFDEVGYNMLINDVTTTTDEVIGETKQENGLEKLEKLEKNSDNIVSKAFYFPISINK